MISQVKAGWVCFGIGMLTAWFFPPLMFLFGVGIVLAIIGICKDRVTQGLTLLFTCVAGMVVTGIVFLALIGSVISDAAEKASRSPQSGLFNAR
jgi:hypothetical protein